MSGQMTVRAPGGSLSAEEGTNATNANAALYFVDRHARASHKDKVAFIEGNRTLTYAALAHRSAQLSRLYKDHGLQREDRAAMILLDTIEFPVIFWGSLKAGIIPIPLNTLLTAEDYELILDDSRAKAVFVSAELLEVVKPAIDRAPHLQAVFVVGESSHGYASFGAALDSCPLSTPVHANPDQCAFWLYSSGSTGRPKGIRHSHANLKATAETYGAQVLGIAPSDVVFSSAKLFFAYGLGNGLTFPMSVGATTVLSPQRPTPQTVFQVMAETQPTVYCAVPTLYAALVAAMEQGIPPGLGRLRRCISAGEALPERTGQSWSRLTGVEILDGVGSTEMLHIYLSNVPGDVVYGSCGVPVPGYELRLVAEGEDDVVGGDVGELLVKGPSATLGYANEANGGGSHSARDWIRTGDLYQRRIDGRFVCRGRKNDTFKVSGIWVSPLEIEEAILAHPSVLEAAVVAAKDEHGLEKPKAFVVLKGEVDAGEFERALKEHVKETIGKWKYPRWIEILDQLPKTATGKVQRHKLRQHVGD